MGLPDTTTARCPRCGGATTFDPASGGLLCAHCGAISAAEIRQAPIVEEDFRETLQRVRRSAAAEVHPGAKEIACPECGARAAMGAYANRCAFCGSPRAQEVNAEQVILPVGVLPHSVPKDVATRAYQGWLSSRWFAPNDMKKRARVEGVDGAYLPFFTYDAHADTRYEGERGDNYQTTESYRDGKGQMQTRTVTKVRWRRASGEVSNRFDDVLVPASESLPEPLVRELEPWPLREMIAFSPQVLLGMIAAHPTLSPEDGFSRAGARMKEVIDETIRRQIGGDHQRIGRSDTRYSQVLFKHILLPAWLLCFRYGQKPYRVVVNARTGEVIGERPYSAWKIAFAVLTGLVAIGAALWLWQSLN